MTERDPSIGADGLTRRDRDLIRDVLARYPEVRRVTLFGSRAMGTFGRGSDIDLALEGPDLDARTLTRIATELEDSDLPYKVDLLLRDDQLEPKLEAHIRRHGKPFGWKQSTWGEEISLEYGKALKDYSEATSGFRVFGTNGPIGWTGKPIADGPGVILGRKGAYRGVHFSPDPFFVIDTAYYVVPKTELDMRWLYYAMIHYQLGQIDDGSPIPSTTRAAVYPREIVVPPPEEQRAIASVLGALDDKIEQNRRTARALERLARSIFRAWFVGFEPVKAKAAGATAFPSMPQPVFDALPTTFTDSPIGPVPEGWAVGVIKDLAALSKTQIKPQETQTAIFDHFSIPAFDAGMRAVVESGSAIKSNKFLVVEGCILLSKLNPRIPRVWLPPPPCGRQQIASTEFLVFVPRSPFDRHYLYCQFKQSAFCEGLAQDASGTSNSHQRVRPDDLLGKEVILSPTTVRMGFGGIADALFALAATNHCESSTLANLRDYLIPKLLSGDVRVWTQASVQVFRGAV